MTEHAKISSSLCMDQRLLHASWLILHLYLLTTAAPTAYRCLQFICNWRATDLSLPNSLNQTQMSQLTLVAPQSSTAALLVEQVPKVADEKVPGGDFGVCSFPMGSRQSSQLCSTAGFCCWNLLLFAVPNAATWREGWTWAAEVVHPYFGSGVSLLLTRDVYF